MLCNLKQPINFLWPHHQCNIVNIISFFQFINGHWGSLHCCNTDHYNRADVAQQLTAPNLTCYSGHTGHLGKSFYTSIIWKLCLQTFPPPQRTVFFFFLGGGGRGCSPSSFPRYYHQSYLISAYNRLGCESLHFVSNLTYLKANCKIYRFCSGRLEKSMKH